MSQQTTHAQGAIDYLSKVRGRLARGRARALFRRRLAITPEVPLVSFTFDDFPRSALLEAGSILRRYDALGTYYVSLSLTGKQSHLGPMFQTEDLKELACLGHELGCHTFAHCHSWNTPPDIYAKAIIENQQALHSVLPEVSFQTFSYPFSAPRLAIKKVASGHFLCCRGGGMKPGRYLFRHSAGAQTFNSGNIDLNLLCAVFLEQTRRNPEVVRNLIRQNAIARGWLIFATHDVRDMPSRFGCTPCFFEQVVHWVLESGARIMPVVRALTHLQGSPSAQTEVSTEPWP